MTPTPTTPQGAEPREDGCKHLGRIEGNSGFIGERFLRCGECGADLDGFPADHPFFLRVTAAPAPAAPTNGGGGWNSPLARSFTTVESIGHAEPERREATIKMRFQGEDAAERAHDALAYLGRLHEAALQPQPTQQGADDFIEATAFEAKVVSILLDAVNTSERLYTTANKIAALYSSGTGR